ncbi:MAG: electron transfer flavoprotein subunit beta/FixA family protein [Acidobacteria bacterium]|nr:electron transfer flavoprotein subunit beta/FixA family protein [Acidobacteriota bacterium]
MRILVTAKPVAIIEDKLVFRDNNRDVDPSCLAHYLNEWDDYSIGEAAKIKEAYEDQEIEIVAVSVGGDHAEDTLRQCLAKGADRAIRIWDEALEEHSGPLTIAKIISEVARNEAPDMVFAGVQSNDQVFSATGTAIAAYLNWPHASAVSKIEWTPGNQRATITRGLEAGLSEQLEIQCPAVLVIQTGVNSLHYPTLREVRDARSKPLEVLSLADLGLGEDELGEAGFHVRSMYVPEKATQAELIEGSRDEQATRLVEIIEEVKRS